MSVDATSGISMPYTPGQASSSADPNSSTQYTTGPLAMTSSSSSQAVGSALADGDNFMQLLIAQLQYQDPMNPADTGQLVSQESQMASVSAMQQLSTQNQQMLSSSLAFGAVAMIGKEVSYEDANGNSATGTVSSVAFGSAGPILAVNGVAVAMTDVLAVNASASSPQITAASRATQDAAAVISQSVANAAATAAGVTSPYATGSDPDIDAIYAAAKKAALAPNFADPSAPTAAELTAWGNSISAAVATAVNAASGTNAAAIKSGLASLQAAATGNANTTNYDYAAELAALN